MTNYFRLAENDSLYILVISVIITLISLFYVIYSHLKLKLEIKKLDMLLDRAIDGNYIESHFDESELSYLESKLRKYISSYEFSSQKNIEEKEKIKTLISDISHQTKTPVANILLYSQLICGNELTPELTEYAEIISSQAEKLSFLINSLVKLSRLETGIIKLNPVINNISSMLFDIISQIKPMADKKGLYIELEYKDEQALFDEKWTNEAILNIVDNAVKYTSKGGVKISVKNFEMFVCIEISDTGCGIPESEQALIYSRFYRSARSYSQDGLGIGLYLSREIITAEKGYLKCSSESGKGSKFSVFLSKM